MVCCLGEHGRSDRVDYWRQSPSAQHISSAIAQRARHGPNPTACPTVVPQHSTLDIRGPVMTPRTFLTAYPSDIVTRPTGPDISFGIATCVTLISNAPHNEDSGSPASVTFREARSAVAAPARSTLCAVARRAPNPSRHRCRTYIRYAR